MPTTIDQRDITLTEHGRPKIIHDVSAIAEYSTLATGYSLEVASSIVSGNNPAGETTRHELRIVRLGIVRATFFWDTVATWEGGAPAYWSITEHVHNATPPHAGPLTGTRPTQPTWTPDFDPASDWWLDAFVWATASSGFSATITPIAGTDIEFTIKALQNTTTRFEGKLKFSHKSDQISSLRGQLRVDGVTTSKQPKKKAAKKK